LEKKLSYSLKIRVGGKVLYQKWASKVKGGADKTRDWVVGEGKKQICNFRGKEGDDA